ncbi:MAG: MopE-related protein, partial [Myxococcales bacterium]
MHSQRALLLSLPLLLLAACSFARDPDVDRFQCAGDADCGEGFTCRTQAATGRGICFQASACTAEVCDGADNDCDGQIDNEPEGVGAPCETDQPGICRSGTTACRDGALVCVAGAPTVLEACNGRDDDCDGQIDEGFDLTSDDKHCGACDKACGAGAKCTASKCAEVACTNSLDDDGDGLVDCLDPDCAGASCGTFGRVCGAGACGCPGAELVESTCGDGTDNDCDGLVDCADSDCDARACGAGCVCAAG